jgi:hypothetical protein
MLGPSPGEPLDGDLMDLGLQDRVTLVTGGSRGLGLAAAHAAVVDHADPAGIRITGLLPVRIATDRVSPPPRPTSPAP